MKCRTCGSLCQFVGAAGRLTAQRCTVCRACWFAHLDSAATQAAMAELTTALEGLLSE